MHTPRPWSLPSEPTSLAQLRAMGVSEAMIRTRLQRGELLRLRHGVFIAATRWPDTPVEQHILLAVAEQVMHPDAVISHASAACIWGLPHPCTGHWHDSAVELTRSAGARPSSGQAIHHLGRLPAGQVLRAAGHVTTSPCRTAVDLARTLELPQALVLLDAAARLAVEGFVARPRRADFRNPALIAAARESLFDAARSVHCRRLDEAISVTEPCRESPIESLAAGYFHVAGLPVPSFQEPIRTAAGTFFADCYWKEQRLVGEADGAGKYDEPGAAVAEKEREQLLRDQDLRMVRWLGKEIMFRPQVVVDRVARALGLG